MLPEEAAGELLLFEELGAWVQLLSSRTAAWPFAVIGVRVTVHVSVIGPDDPWIVFTVTTVTGEPDCRLERVAGVLEGAARTAGRQRREKVK